MWLSLVPLLVTLGHAGEVAVNLEASWNSGPLYLEATEFIHSLGDVDKTVSFVSSISATNGLCSMSDSELLSMIKQLAAETGLSPAKVKMMLFSMSLRFYSPKIRAALTITRDPGTECDAFIYAEYKPLCSVDDIGEVETILFATDLIIIDGERHLVLVGNPEQANYNDLLKATLEFAHTNGLGLALRWHLEENGGFTPLSGYGVELRLKSTEYKATDDSQQADELDGDDIERAAGFNFKRLKERYPELKAEIRKFAKYASDTSQEIQPMKKWQMGDLSLQAAALTLKTHEKTPEATFETLGEIVGNFPQQATKLSRVEVPKKLRKEIEENQDMIGRSVGLHKGASFFSINGMTVDLTSQWGDPFLLLETVRGELDTMERLASIGLTGDVAQRVMRAPRPKGEMESVLPIPSKNIFWINNIESDDFYAHFPRNLQELLRPTFPGVLRRVKLNYLNMVIYMDQAAEVTILHRLIETLLENQLPVRIGIVLTGNSDEAYKQGAVLAYFMSKKDKQRAWRKWYECKDANFDAATLTKKDSKANWDEITAKDSAYWTKAKSSAASFASLGLASSPTILVNGAQVPGLSYANSDANPFENNVYEYLLECVPEIQRAVYYGHLTNSVPVSDFLNRRPNVVTRFNDAILKANPSKLDLINNVYTGQYYGDGAASITMWLVVDMGKIDGWEVAKEMVDYQLNAKDSRIAIINCGSAGKIDDAIQSGKLTTSQILDLLNAHEDLAEYDVAVKADVCAKISLDSVVVNGLVYPGAREFTTADFNLLASIARQGGAADIKEALGSDNGDLVMKTASALSFLPEIKERKSVQFAAGGGGLLTFPPERPNDAIFEVVAIFDPASYDAQKMVPIINTLRKVINMNLTIMFNCVDNLSELPVKAFYRFVLDAEPAATVEQRPQAKFDTLPHHSLLTMAIMPPESWMVAAVEAKHDLDNIKLAEQGDVTASYQLKHILVEGHCSETQTGAPPRGMQIEMTDGRSHVDTLVMANLGYFQLKAHPGFWDLELREGASTDIYKIESVTGASGKEGEQVKITLDSFITKVVRLQVSKRPGMEDVDVLAVTDAPEDNQQIEEESIWSQVGSAIGLGKKKKQANDKPTEVINIFSLASGHMYERLMRIMMVSVINKTETKVKFWILGNYASPAFRDSLPPLAAKFGFEYEFVQYKWPRWLNAQTEKQRTMWGYKILFLDVLFPLEVDKIIFVDADQIVRADLKELIEFDLEGNPYGYTPFCDDRKEMDGFRFWSGGYWKSHLNGRRYHISAIYVVDLKRFRQLAAGDRLRGQYQGLSQDPNSLANLDQDLPNNMIHQVGIKSLPQEWLWCETWCSDASKGKAKTIDLCNNPLTKEPKLSAAVRIVPEWVDYDNQIKELLSGSTAKTNDQTPTTETEATEPKTEL